MRSWLKSPSRALHLTLLLRAMGVVVAARSLKLAIVHMGYLDRTTILFDYWGWGWLPEPSASAARAVLVISAIGGALMTFGRGRLAAAGLGVALACFSYIFLLDKAFFGSLNYAIVCLLWTLVLTRAWRVDATRAWVTRIEALTPRVMLAIIYFYAGVIKLSPDWLRGDVIAEFFEQSPPPSFLLAPTVLATLGVLGATFDLCVGALLLIPRTRKIGLGLAIMFHTSNILMLGVPQVAIGFIIITIALFASEDMQEKLLRIEHMDHHPGDTSSPRALPMGWMCAMLVFLTAHALFPLRPYVEASDSRWTHHAQDFSWWLRSTYMSSDLKVFVQLDGAAPIKVDVPSYIDVEHQKSFALDPALVTQFAHHVARDHARRHPEARAISVQVDSMASLNGRPSQRFILEGVDLAAQPLRYDMSHLVVPLQR